MIKYSKVNTINIFKNFVFIAKKISNNVGMIFVRRAMNSTDLKEANERNIYAKEDFMPAMKEMVNDALKDGRMDTYLRYLKELDIYSNWGKKSN